jgi:threonine synthase
MSDYLQCSACSKKLSSFHSYSCPQCWGPVVYVRDGSKIEHEQHDGIWRYADRLPAAVDPLPYWPVGNTPLLAAPSLAELWNVDQVWVKNETANPTHSFKDRVVSVAIARARKLGLQTVACTSTGNLGHALAAAAAQAGLRCIVLVPSSVEPAKTSAAAALGAKVIRLQGSYDDVNRVAHQLADEVNWGWVNMTLRPFYAEGSKTLIWEVLDQLDTPPSDIVCPIASGSLYSKLVSGADQADAKGIRFHGAQAAGCAPVAKAYDDAEQHVQPVKPDSRAHSLAIGNPADGDTALKAAAASEGEIVAVPESSLPQGVSILGAASGLLTESAGAVTTLGADQLAAAGKFNQASRIVLVITGDGLKGMDLVEDSVLLSESLPTCADTVLEFVGS